LASLQRNGSQNSFQIMIFAMALMLLFILTLLRTSLLTEWQQQLPEGTPNHFAFNIFEQEKTGLEALLAERKIPATPFYPMMRGRLVKVDGEPIQDRLARLEPEGDDFRRELNVTWSSVLADDNEVVEGDWFDAADADQPYVSIEADFAKALAVSVGRGHAAKSGQRTRSRMLWRRAIKGQPKILWKTQPLARNAVRT
jgi:putative ABC transport system permease protein